jgi:hypothetical protein
MDFYFIPKKVKIRVFLKNIFDQLSDDWGFQKYSMFRQSSFYMFWWLFVLLSKILIFLYSERSRWSIQLDDRTAAKRKRRSSSQGWGRHRPSNDALKSGKNKIIFRAGHPLY